MAVNRDKTSFLSDGYGFVSQDSAGIQVGADTNNVELHTQNGVVAGFGPGQGGAVPMMNRNTAFFYDDFVNNNTTSLYNWTAATTGTGVVNAAPSEAGSVGQIGFEKGTVLGSTSRLRMSDLLDTGMWSVIDVSWIVRKRDVGGGGNNFSSEWGLLNSTFNSAISIYTVHNGANSQWVGRTNNGGTVTDTNLVSSGAANTTWKLQCRFESTFYTGLGADQVRFFVNDVLYATHTTNIPGALLAPGVNVAWISGAGAQSVRADTMQLSLWRADGRYPAT